MKGYKRCKCRGEDKRELGNDCPDLRRKGGSWNPAHGTWYGKKDIKGAPKGSRMTLRAGGFATQEEMSGWFAEAERLLSIPEAGPDGYAVRVQILDLIKESRQRGERLPTYADFQRRYAAGAAWRPGTTGDYLTSWLEQHRKAEDWTASTWHSYDAYVRRHFLPQFGDVALDKLTARHLWDMMDAIDAESARITGARTSDDPGVRKSVAGRRPTSVATKRRILAVIKSALAEASASGKDRRQLVTVNVAADMSVGRGDGRRRGRSSKAALWTAEREAKWRRGFTARAEGLPANQQFMAWRSTPARPSNVMIWKPLHLGGFLDAVPDERLQAMFTVIAYCGLRRGEACGLRWEDVDWDTGSVAIGPTIVQVGWAAVEQDHAKAEASENWVRLEDVVMTTLRSWRQQQRQERLQWGPAWTDTGYVFTQSHGLPYHPAYVTQRFERLAWRHQKPPIRLHDLRHGAATMALAAGKSMKEVSAMMRHSSERITSDIYASVLPELKAEVSAAVAAMIPRKASGSNGAP